MLNLVFKKQMIGYCRRIWCSRISYKILNLFFKNFQSTCMLNWVSKDFFCLQEFPKDADFGFQKDAVRIWFSKFFDRVLYENLVFKNFLKMLNLIFKNFQKMLNFIFKNFQKMLNWFSKCFDRGL